MKIIRIKRHVAGPMPATNFWPCNGSCPTATNQHAAMTANFNTSYLNFPLGLLPNSEVEIRTRIVAREFPYRYNMRSADMFLAGEASASSRISSEQFSNTLVVAGFRCDDLEPCTDCLSSISRRSLFSIRFISDDFSCNRKPCTTLL